MWFVFQLQQAEMLRSILHAVWVTSSLSLSFKSLKFPFAAVRSAGIEQLRRISWICLLLDTPKIETHGTTASFWKLWLRAYTHFQQGGKMTLLQIFPCCEELARWICSKEEIAEGSVLQWQNLLKKEKGDESFLKPFHACAAQAEISMLDISR